MKNWKFVRTGNGISLSGFGGEIPPESELSKEIYSELKNNGFDKDKVVLSLAVKYKSIPNARGFFESAVEKVMRSYSNRTVNESIDKQTWSMFKGLTKDAEKEVGNEGNTVKISLFKSPANHSWVPGINDHMIEGAPEFKGAWGKDEALKWTKEWAEKHGLKVGNADTVSEYNSEIQRLTKKAEQLRRMGQGKSAMEVEKQIEKLGKELRELGNKKTGNAAVDSEVVAREVVEGKEYIVEKTSMRNGHDVQFNLYYSMDGSGKRHAGVFKDKDSAVSAGKKIVGNETAEEKKFGHVMREFDRGELKSSSGETVTNPEQAKAIAYSESENVNNLKRARNSIKKG